MWGWNHMGGYGYGGGFGWIFMLLFWIVLIAAAVFIIRAATGRSEPPAERSRALEILKERYARGEIDKEEFEKKRKDLQE